MLWPEGSRARGCPAGPSGPMRVSGNAPSEYSNTWQDAPRQCIVARARDAKGASQGGETYVRGSSRETGIGIE